MLRVLFRSEYQALRGLKRSTKSIRTIKKRKLSSFNLYIELKLGREGHQLICSCSLGRRCTEYDFLATVSWKWYNIWCQFVLKRVLKTAEDINSFFYFVYCLKEELKLKIRGCCPIQDGYFSPSTRPPAPVKKKYLMTSENNTGCFKIFTILHILLNTCYFYQCTHLHYY